MMSVSIEGRICGQSLEEDEGDNCEKKPMYGT